jgi:hypothetical protein
MNQSKWATEEEMKAVIVPDTRTAAEKKLDKMLDDRGAWEMGAEAYPVLYKIAIELLEQALAAQPAPVQEPVAREELTNSQIMASVGRCSAGFSESRPLRQQWDHVCDLIRYVMRERGYTAPLAAPVQEPVAWMHEWDDGERIPMLRKREVDSSDIDSPKSVRPLVYGDATPPAAQPAPVQEPVGEVDSNYRLDPPGLDPAGGTQVSKVWWDGEKLMAKPIPLVDFYQPVQEPVARYSDIISDGGLDPRNKFDVQPAAQSAPLHEWMKPHQKCDEACLFQCTKGFTQFPECANIKRAAQRQWVGLTDDEIEEIHCTPPKARPKGKFPFARMIEAKLKEKNS